VLSRSLAWKRHALSSVEPAFLTRRRAAATPEDLRLLEELLRDELLGHGYSMP
jgi:hypothetical protein